MTHDHTFLSRRRLLGALGLGAGSLFLPSLLPQSHGNDGLTGPARRILFVMTYHGTVYDSWRMRPGGLPEDQAWEADLSPLDESQWSPILSPLRPFADRMMVLDGLDQVTAKPQGGGIGHFVGPINAMTGGIWTGDGPDSRATMPSLDQMIADQIARPDHFRSLEVGTGNHPISYANPGQALPRETRADHLWDRLFPEGKQTPGAPPTIASRLQDQQTSVLDQVAQEYEALRPRLGAEDRHKLDLHRDMVRDLEQQVSGFASIDCSPPPRPDNPSHQDPNAYNDRFSQFAQLLTVAFACDMTRVATYTLGQMPNSAFGAPAGDVHQDFAHQCDPPSPSAIAVEQMTNYNRRHAEHVLELVELLDSVPEEGGTMLDNTLVVWLNEMANGSHRQDPYPMVLVGGHNIPLRWGRYVRWPVDGPTPMGSNHFNSQRPSGFPQNRVLTAIARAFDLDVDVVGIDSVAAQDGSTIDCRGPADRVLA